MMQGLYKQKMWPAISLVFLFFLTGCSSYSFFSPEPRPKSPLWPNPKMHVYIMPKEPIKLCEKKVLLIPAFMDGNQEELWSPSITKLVHSIFLQENLFHTLIIASKNNQDMKDMLADARKQGYDYIMKLVLPSILEPAGNSPGWIGMNLYLISTRKGYSVWYIYGETQLIPRPTRHRFFYKDEFVEAPTVGQGIVSICREMARIMRGS